MAADRAPIDAAHSAPAIAASTGYVPHRFLVSDAVPLYLLGLVPPPPEIGPHLLNATPLEAALAAAASTAEVLAIAPIRSEPEPQPEPEFAHEPTLARTEVVHIATAAEADGDGAPADLNGVHAIVGQIAFGDAQIGDEATSSEHRLASWPPATSLAQDLPAAEEPSSMPHSASRQGGADSLSPAPHAGLATLDLTRRGDAAGGYVPPPDVTYGAIPLQPLAGVASAIDPGVSHPTWQTTPSRKAPTYDRPPPSPPPAVAPRGNWPGFLTGFVMALAIGAGLYISLAGS